jgi:DnaJ-class molecular chaperone
MELVRKHIVCEPCKGNGYLVVRKLNKEVFQSQTCWHCEGKGYTGSSYEWESCLEQGDEVFAGYKDQVTKKDEQGGFYQKL